MLVTYETPVDVMRDEKMFALRTDIFAKSAILGNTPGGKMVRSENFCTLEIYEEPNFYNLG